MSLHEMGQRAKAAARQLARATTEQKNVALNVLADQLLAHSAEVLSANAIDVEAAKANGAPPPKMSDPSKLRVGPSPEREQELLAYWRARK